MKKMYSEPQLYVANVANVPKTYHVTGCFSNYTFFYD